MIERIEDIAGAICKKGKGLLAADESSSTIKKRFDIINLESTEESRRNYREMLFSAKEAIQNYISGVILYDETIRQRTSDGKMFTALLKETGCIPGIKVDIGTTPLAAFPGETITEGLDGLRGRLKEYYCLEARFAKWRGVFSINEKNAPTSGAVRQNAAALARYAALCQETGIVPIVEPEVLMDGNPGTHSIDRCYEVTKYVLEEVFIALREMRIVLEGMILKPNMVIDGYRVRCASVEEVSEKTLHCLKSVVPAAVPGIAFLSGGQSDEEATAHLSAMNRSGFLPWTLTFSYGRALQTAALLTWKGKIENISAGQCAFTQRAKMNSLASLGKWQEKIPCS